jgi:hypothetical protein
VLETRGSPRCIALWKLQATERAVRKQAATINAIIMSNPDALLEGQNKNKRSTSTGL